MKHLLNIFAWIGLFAALETLSVALLNTDLCHNTIEKYPAFISVALATFVSGTITLAILSAVLACKLYKKPKPAVWNPTPEDIAEMEADRRYRY